MKPNDFKIEGCPNFTASEFGSPLNIYAPTIEACQRVRDEVNVEHLRNERFSDAETFGIHRYSAEMGEGAQVMYVHPDGREEIWRYNDEQLRGPGSIPLRINSACRTWEKHKQVYQDIYGKDGLEWMKQISLRSRHLIEKPYDLKLVMGIDNPTYDDMFNRKEWLCCAVDLAFPRMQVLKRIGDLISATDFPHDIFERICKKHFDWVKVYNWGCHCDMRKEVEG